MTAYSVVYASPAPVGNNFNFASKLALRAGVWPIRIVQVETNGGQAGLQATAATANISRYEVSTISGGAVLTPQPLRQGALAASATCRYRALTWNGSSTTYGTDVSVTGTARFLKRRIYQVGAENPWSPPSDLIVAAGSTFYIEVDDPGTSAYPAVLSLIIVWFEEMRVSVSL